MSNRWNWGAGAGRIPYLLGGFTQGADNNGSYVGLQQFRIFITSASGQLQYPFSTTERLEFGFGLTRYSYDLQLDKYYLNQFGQPDGRFERESDLGPVIQVEQVG